MRPSHQSIRKRTDSSRIQGNINKTVVIKSTGTHRLPTGAAFFVWCHLRGHCCFQGWKRAFRWTLDRADDWQLEQLIRHGRGTYWKFLLLLWLRDGRLPEEIKAWSWDEFMSSVFSQGPGAGFPAALGFLSLQGLAYCHPSPCLL